MSTPQSVYLDLMGHEMHVTQWGNPGNPSLVMWHGLARTGRDFDPLAQRLSDQYFVLCPDTIGRGLSGWSSNPAAHYNPPYYAQMALAMLDHYGIDSTAWLGTSMGGLIGMHIASSSDATRINHFIINDIGPEIPAAAVERIVTYAADLPLFAKVSEAETWLRTVYAPFGPADDTFWRHIVETSIRRKGDGQFTLHYDPRIIDMLGVNPELLTVWDIYDKIAVPTHVLRGAKSDILTDDILQKMLARGPKPKVTEFAECGHAPSLASSQDGELIRGLLSAL